MTSDDCNDHIKGDKGNHNPADDEAGLPQSALQPLMLSLLPLTFQVHQVVSVVLLVLINLCRCFLGMVMNSCNLGSDWPDTLLCSHWIPPAQLIFHQSQPCAEASCHCKFWSISPICDNQQWFRDNLDAGSVQLTCHGGEWMFLYLLERAAMAVCAAAPKTNTGTRNQLSPSRSGLLHYLPLAWEGRKAWMDISA